MKRFIAFVLMLVLVFSMGVPSFAATADDQSTSLQSGWGSATSAPSYPSGYFSSWFYRIAHNLFNIYDIQSDLKTGWSDTLTPTGFSGSFYSVIRNSLKTINSNLDYIEVDIESIYSLLSSLFLDVAEIKTDVSLNLGSIDSSLLSLLDIVPDIDSIASSAVSIKTSSSSAVSSLSSIDSTFDTVYDFLSVSLDSYLSNQALFLSSISDDISILQQVHADEDDLTLKEDSKPMEEFFTDTFFNSESDLSLNVNDLGILTQYVREFKTGYNFQENIGNPLPLTLIDSESDFKEWFSDSTGQAMDPTFNGGSGGGGGGEEPDPDPDPDPDPEPIKNWLPLATTEPGGTEIYGGKGWREGWRWSSSSNMPVQITTMFLTGWIPVKNSDIVYFYDFSFSGDNATYFVTYLTDSSYDTVQLNSSVSDENGVISFNVNVSEADFFRVSAYSISDSSIISINQYPIQTASTFSLRAQSVPYEPDVVTSYYADRLLEVERIKGGNK